MRDPIDRWFRLAAWKLHVLHHATEGPVFGLWMLEELAEHGHHLSPGTLYPLLSRMEAHGWLRSKSEAPPSQVQIFEGAFTGKGGSADQLSAEVAVIASPHLGFVLTVPYQLGISGQPFGFGDMNLHRPGWVLGGARAKRPSPITLAQRAAVADSDFHFKRPGYLRCQKLHVLTAISPC
jgi:hypothetical protein